MSPSQGAISIVFVIAVMVLRSTILTGLFTLWSRSSGALRKRVYRWRFAPGQLRSELLAGVRTILFDALVIYGASRLQLIRTVAPTPLRTLATFGAMFVWFELWFYTTHRLLHTRLLLRFHAQHHVGKVTQPLTSLSFSLVERAVLVGGGLGFAAALSHVTPLPMLGLGGYFFVNYLLNLLGHSNVEPLAPGFANSRAGRVLITVTFHAMHHARHRGHYGLFTRVLDRWCGTEWPDYVEVQWRAATEQGLTRLGQRA